MTYLKWAAIAVVAWLAIRWLASVYDGGSANLGGSTTGRWAPLLTYGPECFAWAPPNGVPHEGGA